MHNCGSEYVAHNLNKYLVSKGHEVRVILHRYNGMPFVYEGVEVFPGTGRIDAFAWADIICTHLDFTTSTIIWANAAERPLIHFVHNDIPYHGIMNAVKGQHIVYNSEWLKQANPYEWPSAVLHPPCDINYYNVNDDPINNEYITLISLNERKGGYLFSKIAEAMPDRKFIGVIGSYDNPGALRLTQEQIIQMMPPNVTVIPNSPDILSVYRKTRLLLMPSDYETWGRTATEAMCNGIPVICTPTDGLKENCGDNAVYVGSKREYKEKGDAMVYQGQVSEWVEAIRKFDDENTYKKYSLACRARAAELSPERELEAVEKFILQARF